ncbi:DNA gyrase inhibitor YacG [Sphingobium sp. CAP-1]|uniref:DNA gyrase inhibitor YacG n=1 Tax=Sphingobium sp. CAP-1 TaxID=2676077 RepID=UPI0012BB447E|nr:DNA gyrase inhibitor YacG [Sphingobium sp. CAP-1]QGP79351.1 DNA gyrase inhibitor YacG [Sphingobium sp. CAP-1]
MSPKSSSEPAACPVCGQPAKQETRPFCSPACRDRDLLQWLGEGYRVPGPPSHEATQKNGNYGLDSEPD